MSIRILSLALAGALAAGLAGASAASAPQPERPDAAPSRQQPAPAAIFVTWNGDPTTTVSVDWHLAPGTDLPAVEIRGPGLPGWKRVEGTTFAFPFSTRTVRRAQIDGLRPGSAYELRVGGGRTYRYRTMPATLTRPVRFATGGDTRADPAAFGPMNRIAAARDVDFVLFGGDLAYSNGDPRLVEREAAWFETVTSTLVTAEGRLIPVLAAIGNHEVFSNRDTSAATRQMMRETGVKRGDAPYYTALHAHARDRKYQVVDIGDYLSLVLLNTNHTAPVAGAQTDWLRRVLEARAAVPHVFPVYHVPGYPSVRAFEGSTSAQVREHWAPLFERAGLRVAFENHDHVYKRTYPIRAGRRDSSGVVYIGDGSWGAGPREIGRDHESPAWYLERALPVSHGIIVTLDRETQRLEVLDAAGTLVDAYTARPRAAPVPVVREAFLTPAASLDNVDGAAIWHGPRGEHWLLSTAKTGDVIRVHDAATGAPIRRVGGGGSGAGRLRRPNGIAVMGDMALVVERDNHRVQGFRLPDFAPLGTFGDALLRRPYGLGWYEERPGAYVVYVTDAYEMPDESVPPDSLLGARIKQFRVRLVDGRLHAEHVRSFGDGAGAGVLRVVESIMPDPAHDRLLVAEEDERDSHWKVYDLAGRFQRTFGRGHFPQQAEGIVLYACGDTAGYWVATDQGPRANTFHVFDRLTFEHLGAFRGARAHTTDGVALTQRAFGPFPAGAFYASHADASVAAISWATVADSLGLRKDCRR